MKTQDPKYDIENDRLVNVLTRQPLPDDEPIFIIRAKDKNAALAISYYMGLCRNDEHRQAVKKRLHEFVEFAHNNPEKMKEPTT